MAPGGTVILQLTPEDRLIASRFSGGLTTSLAHDIVDAGGGRAWFADQVARAAAEDAGSATVDWWPELHQSPAETQRQDRARIQPASTVSKLVASRELIRRIESPLQVLEAVVAFWNHRLHVPASGGTYALWRADFSNQLRSHALGTFASMLTAAALHPAMLYYLDADDSTQAHPNENLARELLELHTVGAGNFSEDDVQSCARILTGYTLQVNDQSVATYDPTRHWTGPVRVLGFTHENTRSDGRPVAEALMAYLARHPSTARSVATEMAQAFVDDEPPMSLVERLATIYLEADTAITPVLEALIASPEFLASAGSKLADPEQDVVKSYRALGVHIRGPRSDGRAADRVLAQVSTFGGHSFNWPTPEGAPLATADWATPSRCLASFRVHWDLSHGIFRSSDLTYRNPKDWLPHLPMRLEEILDQLCRELLGTNAPSEIIDEACWLVGARPGDDVTLRHPLLTRFWGPTLAMIMDHPSSFQR